MICGIRISSVLQEHDCNLGMKRKGGEGGGKVNKTKHFFPNATLPPVAPTNVPPAYFWRLHNAGACSHSD